MTKTYYLQREQVLNIGIQEAWSFFSSPFNLAKITPPYMRFNITSSETKERIYDNMQIRYIIRPVLGIPMNWHTLISHTNPPFRFTDSQTKGPYKKWIHQHEFEEMGGKTLVRDNIEYELPFGILGDLVHRLFVRRQLEEIFDYRRKALNSFFK